MDGSQSHASQISKLINSWYGSSAIQRMYYWVYVRRARVATRVPASDIYHHIDESMCPLLDMHACKHTSWRVHQTRSWKAIMDDGSLIRSLSFLGVGTYIIYHYPGMCSITIYTNRIKRQWRENTEVLIDAVVLIHVKYIYSLVRFPAVVHFGFISPKSKFSNFNYIS
jgi:hypothetical protein